MSVCQTGHYAIPILTRFHAAVKGLGKVGGPRPVAKAHWSEKWDWQCSNRAEVAQVVEMLWPYLGPRKRNQILECQRRVEAERLGGLTIYHSKLTSEQEQAIKALLAAGQMPKDIAERYEVSASTIRNMRAGKFCPATRVRRQKALETNYTYV